MKQKQWILALIISLGALNTLPQKRLAQADPVAQSQPTAHYVVENATQFLEAIGSKRSILLKPNRYNLSEVLSAVANPHIEVRDELLYLVNLENLAIYGEDVRTTKIVVESPFSAVLGFENSHDISVENLELGHAPPSDAICLGAVLASFNSHNLRFKNLKLFGSGAFGLWAENSKNIVMQDSVIKESTSGLMWLYNVKQLTVDNSVFVDNRGGVNISGNSDFLRFSNSQFLHNRARGIEYYSNALFKIEDQPAELILHKNRIGYNDATALAEGLTQKLKQAELTLYKNSWPEESPE